MKARQLNSWKIFVYALALYAACLFLLLPKLSLWLDELIDLRQIRDHDLPGLLAQVPVNAGGVPLSYLVRAGFIHLFGYSRFSGRLPSALFSLGACAGIFMLGRWLKLRYPLLSVFIFCSMPLQLRYALESRPYSQALALTIWATAVFVRLRETPGWGKALLYGFLALASLYTQPYAVFVFLAHIVWLCCFKTRPNRLKMMSYTGLPVMLAALGFLPWHLWAIHLWNQSAAAQQRYEAGWRTIPVILREIVGGGYPGTALTIALVCAGFKLGLHGRERCFWALYLILPLALPVLADVVFGYFFAIRQTIFVLTPLALLASLGLEEIARRHGKSALGAGTLLFAIFAGENIHFFSKPREDWQAASRLLRELADRGDCLLFAPADSIDLYRFFEPRLSPGNCFSGARPFRAVAVAVSPYEPNHQLILKKLSESGWVKSKELRRQEPKVELYERRK